MCTCTFQRLELSKCPLGKRITGCPAFLFLSSVLQETCFLEVLYLFLFCISFPADVRMDFIFSPLFFLFANPEGLTIICVLSAHCFSVELNSFHCLFTSCTAGWQCLLSTPLLFVIILQEYPSETVCMQNIYESFSGSIASCFIMSTHNVRGGSWW